MKQFTARTLIALATIVAALTLTSPSAHAAPTSGLTISPTSVDVTVAPGNSYSGQMFVLNQSEVDTTYKVYATPYSVTGEEYKPYFTPVPGATDITKWFTFGDQGGDLKVGKQDTIPFTIAVPKGTGAGSYYATVFAETENKGTSGVVTHKRVGMVVYLRVSGDAVQKGNVADWDVPWLQQQPLSAHLKMANSGSVHYKAEVSVTVSDLFGNKKFTDKRQPEILPQKLRSIPITWQNSATFGFFKVNGEVTYLGKTEKLPSKLVFIASPLMQLVTVGVLLLSVITLVYLGKRRAATHTK